jgi:hypothetical protein
MRLMRDCSIEVSWIDSCLNGQDGTSIPGTTKMITLQRPPCSDLEPRRELIRELRRKRRTYREVARLLHERLGLHAAPSTLRSFVKVHAILEPNDGSGLTSASYLMSGAKVSISSH